MSELTAAEILDTWKCGNYKLKKTYGIALYRDKTLFGLYKNISEFHAICEIISVAEGWRSLAIFDDVVLAEGITFEMAFKPIINYFQLFASKAENRIYIYRYGLGAYFQSTRYYKMPDEIFEYIIGQLTSIPPCCVNKYIELGCDMRKMALNYLSQLDGKEDPYLVTIKDDNGKDLIIKSLPFIPCSPNCRHTEYYSKVYSNFWKKMVERYGIGKREYDKIWKKIPEKDKKL